MASRGDENRGRGVEGLPGRDLQTDRNRGTSISCGGKGRCERAAAGAAGDIVVRHQSGYRRTTGTFERQQRTPYGIGSRRPGLRTLNSGRNNVGVTAGVHR